MPALFLKQDFGCQQTSEPLIWEEMWARLIIVELKETYQENQVKILFLYTVNIEWNTEGQLRQLHGSGPLTILTSPSGHIHRRLYSGIGRHCPRTRVQARGRASGFLVQLLKVLFLLHSIFFPSDCESQRYIWGIQVSGSRWKFSVWSLIDCCHYSQARLVSHLNQT